VLKSFPFCFCFSCFFLILLFSVQNGAAQNLVANPSFERGDKGPQNWMFWRRSFQEGARLGEGVWEETVARSGKRSVRIDGAPQGNQIWAQHHIPVSPNWLYRASVWMRIERCYSWGADLIVSARDKENRVLESFHFRGPTGTRDWHFLEGYCVMPSNATQASIELRVLLSPGRAYFDDVSLEPVGPYEASVVAIEPEARREAKLAYLQSLSTHIQTSHWQWATQIKNAPSILFFVDRIGGQREIVELAQRFGFPWRAVACCEDAHPQYQTGEYYDNLTREDMEEACRRALEKPWDVLVVSGTIWTNTLSESTRQLVLEAVASGKTLVYIGRPRGGDYPELWKALGLSAVELSSDPGTPQGIGQGLLSCWPEALPPIPVLKCQLAGGRVLAFARTQKDNELPLLVENAYGRGRTLFVAYAAEAPTVEVRGPGLTPFLTPRETEELLFPYYEYFLASVMKWLTWAASPQHWAVHNIAIQQDNESTVTARLKHAPALPQMTVQWRWRDAAGRLLCQGLKALQEGQTETDIAGPPVPKRPAGGHLFVEAIFADPNGALDWAAACTSARGPQLVLALDKPVFSQGEIIRGKAKWQQGQWPAPLRLPLILRLTLRDCYGWEWETQNLTWMRAGEPQRSLAPTGEIAFQLHQSQWLQASGGYIWGQLVDAAGHILAEDSIPFVRKSAHSWEDWHNHIWSVFGRSGYRAYQHPYLAASLHTMGIDTLLFNIAGEEWRIGAAYDFRLLPIGIYGLYATASGMGEYAETGDRKYLQRRPCPNNPEYIEKQEKTITDVIEKLGMYAPAAYCMADENNLTNYNSSFDFCMCPFCLEKMRQWLQKRWGDIAALNQAWGTDFKRWEDVVPDTFEEALRRGRFVSWADHRVFMDESFVHIWARAKEIIRRKDPRGLVSISGTPDPAAYGGYDWLQLLGTLDALMPYMGNVAAEIQRSVAPHMPRLPWAAGYGSRGADVSYSIWRAALNGCRGIGAFYQPSMIEPDFTWPQSARDMETVTRPLRNGLGKLLFAAQPALAQIALYHSMPSLRAAYTLGLEREQEDELKGFIKGLEALGITFRIVEGRQIEQGELLTQKPKILVLPLALAMSDKELAQLAAYVGAGGRLLVTGGTPALYDERLQKRDLLSSAQWQKLFAACPCAAEQIFAKEVDRLLSVPADKLWHMDYGKQMLYTENLAFARYWRDVKFRACPEIRKRCERGESYLSQALAWGQAQPIAQARWEDGSPVRDCQWAEWKLQGGRIVAVLRDRSAPSARTLSALLAPRGVAYDVISGKKMSAASVQKKLGPGEAAVWAVLAQPLGDPVIRVTKGVLAPNTSCELSLYLPRAPQSAVVRLEVQAPARIIADFPAAWNIMPSLLGASQSRESWLALPGLSQNILLTQGRANVILHLPANLPVPCRLMIKDVISHATKTLAISRPKQ